MSKRNILILIAFFIFLAAIFAIDFKLTQRRQKQEMEDIVDAIASYPAFSSVIKEITYTSSTEGVLLTIEFQDFFEKAPVVEQYGFMNAYTNRLREYLEASEWNTCWKQEDIILSSANLESEYKYVSACWDKGVKSNDYNELFYVDGEVAYTYKLYSEFKEEYITALEEEFYNGYSDLLIMKYAVRVFKLLTYGGATLTWDHEAEEIIEEIMERYKITRKQFSTIHRKYFLVFYN